MPDSYGRRYAYVNMMFSYSSGIIHQLGHRASLCRRNAIPVDFYYLPARSNSDIPVESDTALSILPVQGSNPFVIRYRQCAIIRALCRRYDGVILRYPLFDPVSWLMLSGLRNLVFEHHTIADHELRANGDKRLVTERLFSGFLLRRARAHIGVTSEIVDDMVARYNVNSPIAVFPNALDFESFPLLNDGKLLVGDRIRFLFAASEFYPWHGLVGFLKAWQRCAPENCELVLAGNLTAEQQALAAEQGSVRVMGHCSPDMMKELYRQCDIGVTSFDLEVKGLTEACTLKVREYLAQGMLVLSGHRDAAFDGDFPYFHIQKSPDITAALEYFRQFSGVSRETVRNQAEPFISEKKKFEAVVGFLDSVFA